MKIRPAFVAAVVAISGTSALAAQWARVTDDQVDLFDGPTRKHHSLQKVAKGTMVQASNYATESYHKVRLQDGTIGWIKGSVLLLRGTPGGANAAEGFKSPKGDKKKGKAAPEAEAPPPDASSVDLPPPIPEN